MKGVRCCTKGVTGDALHARAASVLLLCAHVLVYTAMRMTGTVTGQARPEIRKPALLRAPQCSTADVLPKQPCTVHY